MMCWVDKLIDEGLLQKGDSRQVSPERGLCPVCGGCAMAVDHDCPYSPCCCGGDPENVLPSIY